MKVYGAVFLALDRGVEETPSTLIPAVWLSVRGGSQMHGPQKASTHSLSESAVPHYR
jgi:hypothetical protein